MNTTFYIKTPKSLIALGIPLFIAIISFLITQTEKFNLNRTLVSNAILVDMLIIAPLLYFFVIRKSNIDKINIARIFIFCLLGVGFILDNRDTPILHYINTFVYPSIEFVLIIWIGRNFYLAHQEAKLHHQETDFAIFCRRVLNKVIGNEKISDFFSSEIVALYYAFHWSKKTKIDDEKMFSTYKENGIIPILCVLIFVILIETIVTHLLLGLWNEIFAWVITGLSLYTCLQLFAHIRAVKVRHIELGTNELKIYNGLASEIIINYKDIESLELSNKIPENKKYIKTALLGNLEKHNCILYLKKPAQIIKFLGIKKCADTILFHTDKSKNLLNALTTKIKDNNR